MKDPLRLLIVGAHPDDADYAAGGLVALYRQAGHTVKMVSLTNGDAGHHIQAGPALANRRRQEASASANIVGASYDVFDHHDGELQPTLDIRRQVISLIRTFQPDLILTHRPNDYHPDHRYASQLVQDSAYLVTVPAIVPEVPHLQSDPVIAYLPDHFQKPTPFQPTVAIDVGPVVSKIVAMLDCHVSQFYEWLPYNGKHLSEVPSSESERRVWLENHVRNRLRAQADRFRQVLIECYGRKRGKEVTYAEGFEGCEYGTPLDQEASLRLFGFM